MTTSKSSVSIWMVHGTWAQFATWPSAGSSIGRALERELGPHLYIRTFRWTGRNRAIARQAAVEEFIAAVKSNDISDKNFIISHSHGGNIALAAAAAHPELIDGVVTLNTPFLTLVKRNQFVAALNGILAAFAITVLLNGALQELLGEALTWGKRLGVSTVVAVICVFFAFAMFGYRAPHGSTAQGFSRPSFGGGNRSKPRVLAITYSDDEALGLLSTGEVLANLPSLLLHRYALPAVFLAIGALHYVEHWQFSGPVIAIHIGSIMESYGEMRGSEAAVEMISRWYVPILSEQDVRELSEFIWYEVSDGFFVYLLFMSVLSYFVTFWVYLGLISLLAAYVTRGALFGEGFGPRAIVSALVTRTVVSPSPLSSCDMDIVVVSKEQSLRLRHSDAYDNAAVIRTVVDWVKAAVSGNEMRRAEARDREDRRSIEDVTPSTR